mmetsp:Transcript_10017/g.27700  ORF Transcript_10017/g.27700 Transcript_10017/m.27700 type:complete len:80 (+) Transcript_10017:41-280(+)
MEQAGATMEKDHDGITPLCWSASRGQLGIVKYLVQAGADPMEKSKWGEMPLHFAAGKGHFDVVWYLVGHESFLQLFEQQ